jgi:hypothetical protein
LIRKWEESIEWAERGGKGEGNWKGGKLAERGEERAERRWKDVVGRRGREWADRTGKGGQRERGKELGIEKEGREWDWAESKGGGSGHREGGSEWAERRQKGMGRKKARRVGSEEKRDWAVKGRERGQ